MVPHVHSVEKMTPVNWWFGKGGETRKGLSFQGVWIINDLKLIPPLYISIICTYIYIHIYVYNYMCIYIYIYPIAYIHYMSPVNPDWNPPKPCFLSGWLLEFAPISKPRGALISSADRVPTRVSPAKSMGNHGSYHPEMDGMLYIYVFMCIYICIFMRWTKKYI